MAKHNPEFKNMTIPVSSLHVNEDWNPRHDYRHIDMLAASIRANGLEAPLVVSVMKKTKEEDPTEYFLIAGFRRHKAVCNLGWTEIPVRVSNATNDRQLALINCAENTGREDLTTFDKAKMFFDLKDSFKVNSKTLSDQVKYSQGYIDNLIKCWRDLAPEIKEEWGEECSNEEIIWCTIDNMKKLCRHRLEDRTPDFEKQLTEWNELKGEDGDGSSPGNPNKEGKGKGKGKGSKKPGRNPTDILAMHKSVNETCRAGKMKDVALDVLMWCAAKSDDFPQLAKLK